MKIQALPAPKDHCLLHHLSWHAAAANLIRDGENMGRKSSGSSGSGACGDGSNVVKEQIGVYPLDGLAIQWDNMPEVRDRLRGGDNLLKHWDHVQKAIVNSHVGKVVENLRVNAFVLRPLFEIMAKNDQKSPCIDKLQDEVKLLFTRMKITFTKHQDRIYQDSWAIRRMCTLAKSQVFRDGPPKETTAYSDKMLFFFMFVFYMEAFAKQISLTVPNP